MQKLIRRILKRSPERIAPHPQGVASHEETASDFRGIFVFEEQKSSTKASSTQMDKPFYSWLHSVAPAFPVKADNVRILKEPVEFYQTLLEKCSTAHHRIVLSSLYLGTGHLEQALVDSIRRRMVEQQGILNVKILLDHCRGSRGAVNSRSMVEPLLREKPDSVQVSLYHTVALRGVLRWILPERFNEIVGLQHMKLYIFDNSVIISGANLSNDYFTNRQDRYVLIEDCADLANFYTNLVSRVSEFSFQLLPNGSTSLHSSWSSQCHPFKGNKTEFIEQAHNRVWKLFSAMVSKPENDQQNSADTWIFPLVQMGQLKIHHDSEVFLKLLEEAPLGSHVHLATGYFNLPNNYMEKILLRSKATYTLLTAHPTANGFLKARGLAGGIPALYTQLAKEFFFRACSLKQQNRVQILEYLHPGWTYHGKGLWLTLPNQKLPSLSLIGSPNYGSRSVERDLETQVAIATSNPALQRKLADERDRLYNKGIPITEATFSENDRLVPFWVLCTSLFFRRLF